MEECDLCGLTVGKLLDDEAGAFGDRECVAYPDRDVRFTFRQFHDRVDLAACGLMALGVRKAEHVAVWATNVPEWLVLQYATAKIGAILVPISPAYRASELAIVLNLSETTTLFFSGSAGPDPVA